jgi:hypothetical protein
MVPPLLFEDMLLDREKLQVRLVHADQFQVSTSKFQVAFNLKPGI